MVVYEKLFDDKEYLRCEILEVLAKSYRVKLVDYGLEMTVEKVFPQDKSKHTGPNWVSQNLNYRNINLTEKLYFSKSVA